VLVLIPTRSVELRHVYPVPAAPAQVLAHLARPDHYIGLSPLLVEVRDVREEAGETHYVAVERFRFLGFLRHDNLIRVTLETEGSGLPETAAVHGRVVSPGGVRMTYRFDIEADAAGTGSRMTDTLQLTAPLGLLRFASGQAAAVQRARAQVLAARMSALD
jgi:hypothetical protein